MTRPVDDACAKANQLFTSGRLKLRPEFVPPRTPLLEQTNKGAVPREIFQTLGLTLDKGGPEQPDLFGPGQIEHHPPVGDFTAFAQPWLRAAGLSE